MIKKYRHRVASKGDLELIKNQVDSRDRDRDRNRDRQHQLKKQVMKIGKEKEEMR